MGFGSLGASPSEIKRAIALQYRFRSTANSTFFDPLVVMQAANDGTKLALSRFGAFVRTSAKSSIRKRKKSSLPGNPPSSHLGTLKRYIFFGYDASRKSVVVGPTLAPDRKGTVPEILEYGGVSRGKAIKIHRKIGDGAEIRIDGPDSTTTKINRFGARVTYIKIRTQAQADRANQLQDLLYDSPVSGRVAARPYMQPAFDKYLPQLPALWANSIK